MSKASTDGKITNHKKYKDKEYSYKYFESRFYVDGKQYTARSKISQKDADQLAGIKKQAIKNNEQKLKSNRETVLNWCEEWLETYKLGKVTDKVYKQYAYHISLITNKLGKLKIKDIKDNDLQKILNKRSGYSKSDTKKLMNTIKSVFKKAKINQFITHDPSEGLEMPKTAKEGKRRSITELERKLILKTAETHYAGLAIKFLLYTGTRPAEMMALIGKDIDFKNNRVIISKALESGKDEIKDPKSEAGNREVPIPPFLIKELEYIKNEPFKPVFTQPTNSKRYSKSSFRVAWLDYLKQMDINNGAVVKDGEITISSFPPDYDLVPYCLRHTFCSDLETSGVEINVAKTLMGHSDISVTSKIYTHTSNKSIDKAAEKYNEFLAKTGS